MNDQKCNYLRNYEEEELCGYIVTKKMKRIWNVELGILNEVQRICNKYNLTYYAIAGTLLGAVRHQGFIPWDDDLDIGMPRADYNKFMEISQKEIQSPFFVQTYKSEPSFPYDMIKIRNSDTTGCTPWEILTRCNKGIFLDIFPIDNEPDNKRLRIEENKQNAILLNKAANIARETESSGNRLVRTIKNCIKKILRFPVFQNLKYQYIETVIKSYSVHNTSETMFCGMRSFSNPDKFRWKRECCLSVEEVPFENMTIHIPCGYDEILKSIYGNYMEFVVGDSFHEGTIYEPDIPYEQYFYRNRGC